MGGIYKPCSYITADRVLREGFIVCVRKNIYATYESTFDSQFIFAVSNTSDVHLWEQTMYLDDISLKEQNVMSDDMMTQLNIQRHKCWVWTYDQYGLISKLIHQP